MNIIDLKKYRRFQTTVEAIHYMANDKDALRIYAAVYKDGKEVVEYFNIYPKGIRTEQLIYFLDTCDIYVERD
jgi:hypothetical protein